MKTLLIDIETSPMLSHTWGTYNQNIGLNQIMESTEMLCFAAKWLDGKQTLFWSQHHDGYDTMVEAAHSLLDQAEVVMHYNGAKFDIPHLNREFVEAGFGPPAPYQQIDLLKTVKKQFRFPSNKLAYVSQTLGLEGKLKHTGHELWVQCMAGDDEAWKLMRRYNKQDVALLEELYYKLQPWITQHPSLGLYSSEKDACPGCGGEALERRGFAYTKVSAFQRYRCTDCGKWSRSTKREDYVNVVPAE